MVPKSVVFGGGAVLSKREASRQAKMEKISQRTEDDCVVCVLAMVMGAPYTYEKVLQDSRKYPTTDNEGHTIAWWKLVFQIPHMKMGHIVAIDRFGVIDPQDRPAEYRSVDDFCGIFKVGGWRLYSAHFWLVQKRDAF
jgi:hypothetical protein